MRVLFLVPYPIEGASNRYRVEQYLPYLKREGVEYSLHPFWSSSAYRVLYKEGYYLQKFFFFICASALRIFDLLVILRYDIVFIHREAYPLGGAFFETIISLLGKPIIFDFDDAIFLPASSRPNNFIERFKNPGKVASIIKRSKYVIGGNSFLADFALRYNPSVSVIPTPIDTDKYHPEDRKPADKIVIGWIGSATTLDFLHPMRDIFIRLSKEYPHITFKIVGGEFSINGVSDITCKPWSLKEEIEDLKTFDIGIMPMPNNDWTNGKCGFKAILYMSMGIPCICSAVGMNKEVITDGVNGFLADTQDEWFEKLTRLIQDSQLRRNFGARGRMKVEGEYSLRVNAPIFFEVLKKVYQEKHCHRVL